jgi:HlyD family secretion protein
VTRIQVGAVAVGVLVLVLAGPRILLGPTVTVETVTQRPFIQTVVASGRVVTPHRVAIGVQMAGTVRRIPVAEGQHVLAGAPLIELEASELNAAWQQALQGIEQATARLRQVREVQAPVAQEAVTQARLKHDAARDALRRSAALLAIGAIAQVTFDDATRAEGTAAAQLEAAEHQLATARPAGSDAAVAIAAQAQAQAAADVARARLGYATVVAPQEGTLISRAVEPGDVVQPGQILLALSPVGATELEVQVDEKNLHLLRVGQPAVASADAYAEQRFSAVLSYINPGIDAQRGAVAVKFRVATPPPYLRQDMTISVDVQVARRANAVLVPIDAVRGTASESPWVLKVNGRRAVRQTVTLGLRSDAVAEVLSGLRAGDQVVPISVATATDGSRIRAVGRAAP